MFKVDTKLRNCEKSFDFDSKNNTQNNDSFLKFFSKIANL